MPLRSTHKSFSHIPTITRAVYFPSPVCGLNMATGGVTGIISHISKAALRQGVRPGGEGEET